MTLKEEVLMTLERVPDYKMSELLHFMRFLAECPVNLGRREKPKGKPRNLAGILKDKVWVSDDCFIDKLEYVSPEELKMLEEVRAKKKAELQEATA